MKKRLIAGLLAATMMLLLAACGNASSSTNGSSQQDKKEYLDETEISSLFTTPDDYKGKYVVLTGKIFTAPEVDGDVTALQIWHDPSNAEKNFIVKYTGPETFNTDDYVKVDGKITGTFEGENMMGGTVSAPLIETDSVEVQSYMDAVAPTVNEFTPENAISEQNGISLKVDKIEFAENETRVYLTESNSSPDKYSFNNYSIKIVQNGTQIEQDLSSNSSYEGDYAKLSDDTLPNASSSGVLVFPAIDSSASFQIYAEGYSDNYELEFAPFTIDISAQ